MTVGYICAAIAILIWGVTFVNTKALLQSFSSFEILVIRFVVAYVALWIAAPRRFRFSSWREEGLFAAMGVTGVSLYQYLENCAIHYTNASNVSIIVSASPMGTAVLSALLLREKVLSLRFLGGFLLAMAGLSLVCLNGVTACHFSPFGDFLAFCSMASWSAYSVLITRINVRDRDPVLLIRRTFFWGVLSMVPFIPSGFDFDPGRNLARFTDPLMLVHLVFLGFFASALCYILWNRACRALGTVRATCGIYLSPAITAVAANLILGETLTATAVVGMLVTTVGMVLCGRK